MKLKPARRKKNCKQKRDKVLPVVHKENRINYRGFFNNFCVIVTDEEAIKNLNSRGYFGRGNLSRTVPSYNKQLNIIRNRQFESREKFNNLTKSEPPLTVVIDDSDDDETVSYNPQLRKTIQIAENLHLCLEEAFFLSYYLNCLIIYNLDNQLIDKNKLWQLFIKTQPNFVSNYVVYHYFRARNWVVKPGIKFGGDFLLYKWGPPFFHASYLVLIKTNNRSIEWTDLFGLNRLANTAAKEILICCVSWPILSEDEIIKSPDILNEFKISPILMRRWLSKSNC